MADVLLDTNVLLDLFTADPVWEARSAAAMPPLPGFYIGAHAAVQGMVILTWDPTRSKAYFPSVTLIEPPAN